MNFSRESAVILAWLAVSAGLALSSTAASAADAVLRVEQINGEAQIDQLGETRMLKLGDEVRDRDVIHVAEGAYLALRFAQDGALELGPGTALAIERLPASAEGNDLRSILSLWKGYLHVVWKHPANTRWPLFVYFGGQRASLVDGEYFFERLGNRLRSCVAAGRLATTSISGDAPETLRPSACYEIAQGGALKTEPRALESWVAVRQSFRLNPDPSKPVHAFPSSEPEPTTEQSDEAEHAALPLLPTPPLTTVYAAPPASSSSSTIRPAPSVPSRSQTALVFTAKKPAAAASSTAAVAAPATAAAPSSPPAPTAAPGSAAVLPHPAPAAPAVPPSPPATPASAAVAAAGATATVPADPGAGWTIIIGSYADPQNAAQIQQKLIAAGYTPFLRVKNVDGRIWNSVQIRGYTTREAAEARMGEIGSRLGLANLRVVLLP